MDEEEIERLVVSVRADTAGFARDVAAMKGQVEGGLGAGADRAGRAIETALGRAVRSGKFGFEDLKRTALAVMADIAVASVKGAIGGRGARGGLLQAGLSLASALTGAPGRATGGPVAPGAAYRVGERGPELFVPTSSGAVAPIVGGGGRDVRVAITINAGQGDGAEALARSGRQVARAVRAALEAS